MGAELKATEKREIGLDFIRGIAILLAMGWHYNRSGPAQSLWIENAVLFPGKTIGWAGVDIFFVLSGFLVGGLILRERSLYGTFDGGRFLIRRAFKIWPVLYAFIALQLVANLRPWDSYLFQTLFHVQNYFVTPLDHLWSLAVEEHFYLIFAISFALFTNRKMDLKRFPTVLVALIILAPITRTIGYFEGANLRDMQWQTHYRLDGLAIGVLLAYLKIFEPAHFDFLCQRKASLLTIAIAAALIVGFGDQWPWFRPIFGFSTAMVGGAALLLFALNNERMSNPGILVRLLAVIGTYSYALYVFHVGWARIAKALWEKAHLAADSMTLICFEYIGAIFVAMLITKTLERPLLLVRNRLYPAKAAALAPD